MRVGACSHLLQNSQNEKRFSHSAECDPGDNNRARLYKAW